MSALRGVENKTLSFFTSKVQVILNRNYLPIFFFAVTLLGSLLKELKVVPNSYFSNSKNPLNVYFVKVSWGWNLALLLPFIFLSNYYARNFIFMIKRLTSVVVATAIWLFCTKILFSYIENELGTCFESNDKQEILEGFNKKSDCKNAGNYWEGFDISGHSFILSYSTLIIVEELVPMMRLVKKCENRTLFLDALYLALHALYLALSAIALIWVWMFVCTSVYFHNLGQNVAGTVVGVSCWLVTYKIWYTYPFSPGLPTVQEDNEKDK